MRPLAALATRAPGTLSTTSRSSEKAEKGETTVGEAIFDIVRKYRDKRDDRGGVGGWVNSVSG